MGAAELEDKTVFEGRSLGYPRPVAGELTFNTGMVAYPEALTDPSQRGQILILTYPLIGNYGVPAVHDVNGIDAFESSQVEIGELVVSQVSPSYHHWSASKGLLGTAL